MMAPANSFAIVAFGDSITDGTASTMNGDDRWPDVLSRRLHAVHGNRIAVVNAGIEAAQQRFHAGEEKPPKPARATVLIRAQPTAPPSSKSLNSFVT